MEIFQGDDPLVENNVFLDRYYLGGIPKGSEKPESVQITFEYDTDGILQVSAVVESTEVRRFFQENRRIRPRPMRNSVPEGLSDSAKIR